MFPTWIFTELAEGFHPVEIPLDDVQDPDSAVLFKGNLDLTRLEEELEEEKPAMVVVELCNNAAGGFAVSLGNLHGIRARLKNTGVPLILDATRALENALIISRHEEGYLGRDPWVILSEIYALADGLTASLCKDYSVNVGGIAAGANASLFRDMAAMADRSGSGLNHMDRKLIARALANREQVLADVARRVEAAARVHEILAGFALPVSHVPGAHCVLLDVSRMPTFAHLSQPQITFMAWLYRHTGIRVGIHNSGMQKGTWLERCVRFALPVGMPAEQVDALCEALHQHFSEMPEIPVLVLDQKQEGFRGDAKATFTLAGSQPGPEPVEASETVAEIVSEPLAPATVEESTAVVDAGRGTGHGHLPSLRIPEGGLVRTANGPPTVLPTTCRSASAWTARWTWI